MLKSSGEFLYNLSLFEEPWYAKDIFKLIDDLLLAFKNSKTLIAEEELNLSLSYNFPSIFLLSNPKKWKEML